jgi:hypothetical protein
MVMRFQPANIRVIHRRCRSADQLTWYRQRPAPGWLDKPGAGLIVLSNEEVLIGSLTTVFPYQKSNVTLKRTNRGFLIDVGRR